MLNCEGVGGLFIVLDRVCNRSWRRYHSHKTRFKKTEHFSPNMTEKSKYLFNIVWSKYYKFEISWLNEVCVWKSWGDDNIDQWSPPLPKKCQDVHLPFFFTKYFASYNFLPLHQREYECTLWLVTRSTAVACVAITTPLQPHSGVGWQGNRQKLPVVYKCKQRDEVTWKNLNRF